MTIATRCPTCFGPIPCVSHGYAKGVTIHDYQPNDSVNHPAHYTSHPSGVECIQITEHMGFNLGNALKYIWRADLKNDAVEDMRKAVWYIQREIAKREQEAKAQPGLPM